MVLSTRRVLTLPSLSPFGAADPSLLQSSLLVSIDLDRLLRWSARQQRRWPSLVILLGVRYRSTMLNALRHVWRHPLNADAPLSGVSRFVRWQIATRLLPGAAVAFPSLTAPDSSSLVACTAQRKTSIAVSMTSRI